MNSKVYLTEEDFATLTSSLECLIFYPIDEIKHSCNPVSNAIALQVIKKIEKRDIKFDSDQVATIVKSISNYQLKLGNDLKDNEFNLDFQRKINKQLTSLNSLFVAFDI